jgi:hypothetical protein
MPPRTRTASKVKPAAEEQPSNPYAPTAWGTASNFVDLTMPSGQTAQVRQAGVQNLVSAGVLDDVDTLSTLVNEKHVKRVKGKPVVDAKSMMADPKNMLRVLATVDKVVEYMVIQPPVKRPVEQYMDSEGQVKERPIVGREPGVVYTDQIDLNDRMFIFQYSTGGATDVEQFRGQLAEIMGSMAT